MPRLLRLFLALMLLLPAVQAPAHGEGAFSSAPQQAMHDMSMMADHPMRGHEAPVPAHAIHHDCIGCIAPIDIRLYRAAGSPDVRARREARPGDTPISLARAVAPEPPPPRILV